MLDRVNLKLYPWTVLVVLTFVHPPSSGRPTYSLRSNSVIPAKVGIQANNFAPASL